MGRKTTDGVSLLNDSDILPYRRTVGRLMWLIPIRPDIDYAIKEFSRSMKEPTEDDQARLRQTLRYLRGTQEHAYTLSPQVTTTKDSTTDTHVYVDSDWAGCNKTRKSTSGAVVQLLGTCVHHFSRTQATIATSSGEAELYAIGSGAAEGLGMLNLLVETGLAP